MSQRNAKCDKNINFAGYRSKQQLDNLNFLTSTYEAMVLIIVELEQGIYDLSKIIGLPIKLFDNVILDIIVPKETF